MDFFIIGLVSFLASGLTLFSGFGLGTLLLPAFGIFFPLPIAVGMTAVVHFSNNLLKLGLFFKAADFSIAFRFGLLAIIFSWLGAQTLGLLSSQSILGSYSIGSHIFYLRWEKIILATVMIFFALFEIIPVLRDLSFDKKWMNFGGALSGFFGGLSGHQGALRSAFLIRAGLEKKTFMATGIIIACMIDVTRLGVYASHWNEGAILQEWPLILTAILCAFTGVFFGTRILEKVTLSNIQILVTIMLLILGIGIGSGIIGG